MLNETEDTRNSQDKTFQFADHTAPFGVGRWVHTHPCVKSNSHNCAPVSTTMLACCPNGRARQNFPRDPQKPYQLRDPPPFNGNNGEDSRLDGTSRTDLPSDHSNPPHRRTRQACLDRRPSPGSSPADHYHDAHASPTTRTHRHPALARLPPHRVLRLYTTHLRLGSQLVTRSAARRPPRAGRQLLEGVRSRSI